MKNNGLAGARAERDAAKTRFNAHLAQLRSDMKPSNIRERVTQQVSEDAREVYDQTLEVASDSKGIIAGTVAALALWLLRHPILALFDRYFERGEPGEPEG